jgi:hypothetical protein
MAQLTDIGLLRQHTATFYCLSFLRRNGIRSVQTFYKAGVNGARLGKHVMDIMAVRNSRSPLDVVQNFDLTFCQIWYDGESVWATHPEHIRNKRGYLQKDYVSLLVEGNRFLKSRMEKYIKRGFIIQPESNTITITKDMIIKTNCIKDPKDENYYNRWLSRVLFKIILTNKYNLRKGEYKIAKHNFQVNSKRPIGETFTRLTEEELNKPIEQMKSLEPTDGYDSDEFDMEKPESYNSILNKFSEYIPEDKRDEWLAQPEETKYWKTLRKLVELFYSIDYERSPFGDFAEYEQSDDIKSIVLYSIMNNRFIKNYLDILKSSFRNGMDAVTLEDVPVYDLHNHTLDQAIGVDGLKSYLDTLINQRDKTNLPCFVTGCTWPLTLDEIRPIVNKEYYLIFTEPIPEPLPPPDGLLGTQGLGDNPGEAETKLDLIEVIKNAPSDAGGWKNIYHHVVCPFCLSYISRDSGCTYVTHPNPDALPHALSPFCKPQNIIKDIRDKYKTAAGTGHLEVCAECGRACVNHKHFDLNDPPDLEPGHLTAAGNPDYARCAGGGRAEQIARIIAIRNTVTAGEMDPKDLRVLAGFAAEEAAGSPELLAKGAAILAKLPADRSEANLNQIEGGKRRVGKICSHGYETYNSKIKKTRRSRAKKYKGSRKN